MNKTTVNIALAISEKYKVPSPPKPVDENIVTMARMCAKHGMPYVSLYEKQPNGHYRLKSCDKVTGQQIGEVKGIITDIKTELIDDGWFRHEKCAYCGAGNFITCNKCGYGVCTARTKNNWFQCYDVCGARVQLYYGTRTSIRGISAAPASGGSMQGGSAKGTGKALPAAARGQLTGGRRS